MFQTLHEISKNLIFVFVWNYVWKYVNINVSDITGNVALASITRRVRVFLNAYSLFSL